LRGFFVCVLQDKRAVVTHFVTRIKNYSDTRRISQWQKQNQHAA
jgi:hypothetical protein